MTCYAAFGLVPLFAIGLRIAAACYGHDRVERAARGIAGYVPGPLQLDRIVEQFTHAAAAASWWSVVLALLPVSLYSEGIVRSLERFSRASERHARTVRGRLLTPLLTVFVVVVTVLVVGPVLPLFGGLGTGTGPRLLGVLVAFNLLFFAFFVALLAVYRLFASTPISGGPLAVAGFVAASWISGQLLGYVLAVRFVDHFDRAFGMYAPAAVIAALTFLVYLEHLVFLLGYLLALVLYERSPAGAEGDVDDQRPVVRHRDRRRRHRRHPARAR